MFFCEMPYFYIKLIFQEASYVKNQLISNMNIDACISKLNKNKLIDYIKLRISYEMNCLEKEIAAKKQ